MDWITVYISFAKVAELNSFSKASRALNLNPAIVTKHIQWLETQLSINLFVRSTRQVTLTENGKQLYSKIKSFLDDFHNINNSIQDLDNTPQGTIVLGSQSNVLSYNPICEWLGEFMTSYPDIKLEARMGTNSIHLLESDLDCFLGLEKHLLSTSDIVVRKILSFHYCLYAAPSYLKKIKKPLASPKDLSEHKCITYVDTPWEPNGENYFPTSHLQTNIGQAMYVMAVMGHGIFYAPNIFAEHFCRQGKLKHIMENYKSKKNQLNLYYPKKKYQPTRVKLFVDFLCQITDYKN